MDLDSLIFEQLVETDTASDNMIKEETTKDIAVIGMAARLPMAENIDMFWENLIKGRDCVDDFPKSRQKDADIFAELVGVKKQSKGYNNGSYLEEIDKFDYSFFKISPKEAGLMSPEQRIFLETVWQAVEDAGYGNDRLKSSCTGIYFGYSADALFDYKRLIEKVNPELLIDALPGNLSSIIPSRISYLLDLKGPSICIDTACSSSLVAVHLACKALRNMECDVAIAGSVKINLLPVKSSKKLGIESSDGRARTFDDSSDGTGMGEGVAAVILKPLSRALRDGDNIYAVIKGTATNQDGNSIGITAPNAQAQRDVIISALEDAGVDAQTISYIEAHGTGTELGDPIEIDGITKAYRTYTDRNQFCAIGSVKTNIGHLDCASGIIGLIKSVLSLKNKKLPASLHFKQPNRKINFEASPVYVNSELSDWNKDFPRRCGVSAFGLSGTNCHIILEEAPQNDPYEQTKEFQANILTLSAKNENSLKQLIIKYNELIKGNIEINVNDMCYSANTGRWHYKIRLALVFDNKEELSAAFDKLINEGIKTYSENAIYFSGKATEPIVEPSAFDEAASVLIDEANNTFKIERTALSDLCKAYVSGIELDFNLIYKNNTAKRISLPEYPFERKRCWIDMPENSSIIATDSIIQAMQQDSKLMEQIKELIDKQMGEKAEILTESCQDNKRLAESKSFKLLGKEDGIYSDTETLIGSIWCTALGYDEINIKDDFYELGGDSIIAIQIANAYKKSTGIKIDVDDIMEYCTISSLSLFLDSNDNIKKEALVQNIKRADEREYYPLSSAQKRMYIMDKFEGIGNSYNMPMAISIEGSIDIERLKSAVKVIANRHDAFRMSFHIKDNIPVMRVDKEVEFEIDELACTQEEELLSLLKAFVEPFDMQKAPLFRTKIIKISDKKHILFVDMHHIVTDGTSSVIFDKELVQIYLGKELKKPDIQYADYALWQNMQLSSENIKKQETYWLKKFEGEIPVLELPTDFQRPSIQSFEGDRVIFEADNDLSQRIIKLSENTGTTLYMVLMSAYKVLLSKYTGQEEIIVASPITDRKMEELQNVIGMFVNTVALWSNPSSEKTFVQYLQEVKQIALEAFANSDYPFEDLINKVNIKRDMSRTPLFDTMLTLQNTEKLKLETEGLKFGQIGFENNISKFDLNLNISVQNLEAGKKIKFDMEYCTKLFKRETVERLVKHFINVFDTVTKNPEILIKDITIMSQDEQELVVSEFNNTSFEYPRNTSIHKLFEENALKNPDGVAVEIGEQKLIYYELNRRSDCIAQMLNDRGINKEAIVAINVHRTLELMIGIMGVLKAGAAYLPIDPINPDGRIKYMLNDSGAKIVLTLSEYCDRLENLQTGVEIISLEEQQLYIDKGEKLNVEVEPSDAAYVIYTSGSTGKPKGVIVEHHSLLNFLFCINNTFDDSICVKDKALSLTSISFDVSVGELFLPLAFGATLVLFEEHMVSDIGSLCKTIIEKEITFAYIPPTILWEVSKQLLKNKNSVKLNKMLVGVEGIKDYVLEEFVKINEKISIINGYGPTEDTICATFYKYKSHQSVGKNVPIGKPLANTRIYILDKDNNLVPTGVIGELCISGDGLARGYLNSPELTAEKFVLNPFFSMAKLQNCKLEDINQGDSLGVNTEYNEVDCVYKRMYRTGDLAKWLPDGNIEFSGRKDHQVKIRGYRIELGEIESCLLKHELVKDVVVIVRQDNNGLKSLTAYVVSEGNPSISELKKHLGKELPDYMVPAFFVMLDCIPMTSNGKVDRNALPEPDRTVGTGTQYIAPASSTEEKLVLIWQSVLDIDKVGVNDRFFDLGGDSIKAIQVVSSVNQEFNVDLPASKLYSNPTVREIAEFIYEYLESESISTKPEEIEQNETYEGSDGVKQLDQQIAQELIEDNENRSLVCGKQDGYPISLEHNVIVQREITTYLHRSLPLCAILTYDKYMPWYYSNFIQIFSFMDRTGGLFIDYIEPCRCAVEVMHIVNLAYHLLKQHKENIIDFVVEKINLGYNLIMFVDEYYLPNKWAYRKTHFVHSSMIYGYDNEKKQFMAIGFDQNMMFGKIVFDYNDFEDAYESGKIHYKETAPWCELSAIQLIRQNNFDEEYPYSNERFLMELEEYLFSKGDTRRLYSFMYKDNNAVFGIGVYDAAIQNLENLYSGKATIDYRAMHFIWEHKKGIYDRIGYSISRNKLSGEIIELHKEYLKVVDLSNNIRLKSLELENSGIKASTLSANLEMLINNILQMVKELKKADYDILLRIYKQLELELNEPEVQQLNNCINEESDFCVNETCRHSKQVINTSEGLLLKGISEPNKNQLLSDNSSQVQKMDKRIEYLSHIGAKKSDTSLCDISTEYPQMLELKVKMQLDITTYLHRSLPLCIILAYDKYLPWYYSRFIQIFSFKDDRGFSELNYVEPRDCSSEIMDMVCLGYNLLDKVDNIIDFIIERINRGYYLIVNIDEYYLPNKWAYNKNHFVHSSLIYGYDNIAEQFKAISFNKDMLFTMMTFTYAQFVEAYNNGKIHYKKSAPWCESSAIQIVRPKDFEAAFPFSNDRFMRELSSYIFSAGDGERLYTFEYPRDKVVYGIEVYDILIKDLEGLLQGKTIMDYRGIHLLAEHKKLIYERLEYLISKNALTGNIVELKEAYNEVVNLANAMRLIALEFSYKVTDTSSLKNNSNIIAIIEMVRELKATEYDILLKIYRQLELDLKMGQ